MENIREELIESLRRIEPSEDINRSFAILLKTYAEEKKRFFRSIVAYYQKRYEMSSDEFYKSRIGGKDHSWDDEETHSDWVSAEQIVESMNGEIEKLEVVMHDTG